MFVRWAKGSTHGDGEWWIPTCYIRKIYQHEESFKVGDIVEYISDKVSQFDSIYFPPKGTRGKIVGLESEKTPNRCALVQWEKGTTCGDGKWWVLLTIIKKVDKFPKYSFKVGDRVRFRSWDDMESEFGIEPKTGRINIRNKIYFTKDMRPLCKTYATIKSMRVRKDGLMGVELSNLSSNEDIFKDSFFVTDMLEPASTKGR